MSLYRLAAGITYIFDEDGQYWQELPPETLRRDAGMTLAELDAIAETQLRKERDKLRADLAEHDAELESARNTWRRGLEVTVAERDQARAENADLRAVIEAVRGLAERAQYATNASMSRTFHGRPFPASVNTIDLLDVINSKAENQSGSGNDWACDECGKPSTHVTTPGGMRGCDEHFGGRKTP